ncbi:MAG: hypothetical protein JXA57_05160, partial [Armatimonadetes bacterium]|nr:hypothetical protein [Armatimonadota bacterium]
TIGLTPQYFDDFGLYAEWVDLAGGRRAVEWHVAWELVDNRYLPPDARLIPGTQLAGRRTGFSVSYSDADSSSAGTAFLCWQGRDPYDRNAQDAPMGYWGDLLMADDMPAVGFFAYRPTVLQIYSRPGAPDSFYNAPCPAVSTPAMVDQGDTVPLVAKVFDSLAQWWWRRAYETPDAPVKWRAWIPTGDTGAAWLADSSGCCVELVCSGSWATVYVEATWDDSATPLLSDTVAFLVRDTTPPVVYIEASADLTVSPYTPNPLNQVTLGPGSSTAYAYAILRDRFGNYITTCRAAQWWSLDTAVVTVAPGVDSLGQGAITAGRLAGSALVVVLCHECGCGDTLSVISPYPNQVSPIAGSARHAAPSKPVKVYDLRGRLTPHGAPPRGVSLRVTEGRVTRKVDLTGR